MKYKKFLEKLNISGKTIAITGSTGGIGRELCFMLASSKCELILLDRNENKSISLESEIKNKFAFAKIKRITTDLVDLNSVNHAIEELKKYKIDFFIHNAGIYNMPRHITSLGIDNILLTNFAMPYYITEQLKNNVSKFVIVGSIAHSYNKLDESDIEFAHNNKPSHIYGNSKRLLMCAMSASDFNVTIAHPGITLTNMTNHYPKAINWLVKIGIKILFPAPKKACLSIMQALTSPTPKTCWIGPKFCNIWGNPSTKKLKISKKECDFALNYAKKVTNLIKNQNFLH